MIDPPTQIATAHSKEISLFSRRIAAAQIGDAKSSIAASGCTTRRLRLPSPETTTIPIGGLVDAHEKSPPGIIARRDLQLNSGSRHHGVVQVIE
jgi:hypothetical protein